MSSSSLCEVFAKLTVNGREHRLLVCPSETVLYTLRNRLGLRGAKLACGRGECGACTVLLDESPVLACTLLSVRTSKNVTTIEGLHSEICDLGQAMADEGGLQCGFCTPGQMVHAVALLRRGVTDPIEIRRALSGNICRCTGYTGIVVAVARTARARAETIPGFDQ